jgi:hypothetical protein
VGLNGKIATGTLILAVGAGVAYAVQRPSDPSPQGEDRAEAPVSPEDGARNVWEVPLQPDKPDGYDGRPGAHRTPLRQDLTTVRLERLDDGRHAVRLRGETAGDTPSPGLDAIDLRPFIPRVPALAAGNAVLSRVALIQHELNRNQTTYDDPNVDARMWVANNCLKQGLWEVGLEEPADDGMTATFHAWFEFPKAEYARLFAEVNDMPYAEAEALLVDYADLDDLELPLGDLRTVLHEEPLAPFKAHLDDEVERLPEQDKKALLVFNEGIRTYRDWSDPGQQPIRTAKFDEPGFYNSEDAMEFDLRWLAEPEGITWRRVESPRVDPELWELEVTYGNGHRLIVGDVAMAELPARSDAPQAESDTLRLTFGVSTPEIYARPEERADELPAPRPNYLLLLDAEGRHIDNHHAGMDRAYLWREQGDPDRLHLWLVGFERIMLLSHLTMPWPGG